LQVGCGTALPTLYLLQRLLETPISDDTPTTTLHLQDYNLSVLHLVTLPNLILAVIPNDQFDQESDDLDLSPQIVETFKSRLANHKIELEFSYGPWQGLAEHLRQSAKKQDLILTAETIYREDSVSSLLDVLRFGSTSHSTAVTRIEGLEDLDKLDLGSKWPETETVILVAAKASHIALNVQMTIRIPADSRRGYLNRSSTLELAEAWSTLSDRSRPGAVNRKTSSRGQKASDARSSDCHGLKLHRRVRH
jgi:protein-histidine N-methyltransferase